MEPEFEYRLLYKRGTAPVMKGADLRLELETTGVPPGGVRWELETRYRPSKVAYRDVMMQSILAMCKHHNLTPLEIRTPFSQCSGSYIDVIFAKGEDVIKAYEDEITFDFYGTQPKVFDRGIPDSKHVAMCIQMLPADTNLQEVLEKVKSHPRIRQAGKVVDVWSMHHPHSTTFAGRVLVLLELHTEGDSVPLSARAAVPGWFEYRGRVYLVRFAGRPAWCFQCRYNEVGNFHSASTCPRMSCIACKQTGHTSVDCAKRQKQVAKKKLKGHDQVGERRAVTSSERESMERRFAELGIRDQEARELARDFGVLALSESDISG
ncbi:uncharacterized protein PAN0_001c0356 [Moesziomyces antarcticus]|uniref:CCHC-type domain-containing protein n=1 Tax=Pseudozyma antarctica TaxID=84753 RepID=A0A5C3FEY4_PSEA2|nr:uncharacterized protein PAN0_001c0356 [Moesziomyces antarcticus]GAK62159.1 conserved hypothetical protein [Moesziomyces antarcticus]SPO42696.1 uncharacterized protein PSANT_00379 [Moesziomyces antarcticus]